MQTLSDLLRTKGLYVQCPACEKSFSLRKAHLFDATKALPAYAIERLAEDRAGIVEAQRRLRDERAELQRRSFTSAATGGIGQALEMVAASLPGLPTAGQDCRALLKPLDYLAFDGASSGEVHAIKFIEVKTGRQRLSKVQRAIKTAVESGAVNLRIADHRLRLT